MWMLHPKSVIWLQPKPVAEIEYRAWTDDPKLRHASYKGLREVQDNATVYELRWRDHDLEEQGRLTHPMRCDPATDRYIPGSWQAASTKLADNFAR
jgi:bifunctional non-homologous end joining protein LigD